MKNNHLYIITALLLLSACKQEGEVKFALTVKKGNAVMPVNAAQVYFMPADSADVTNTLKYWDDSNYDNRPEMLKALTDDPDLGLDFLHSQIKNARTPYEADSFKRMLVLIDSLTKDRLQRLPQAEIDYKQNETRTTTLINTFVSQGANCTTDGAGACTVTLPAGKYRILIKNNACLNVYLPPAINSYHFDSVTVKAGKTATVNTLLNKCE